MTLWHFNIDDFPENQMAQTISRLPANVRPEVTRYFATDDQKSRLLARLLVQSYVANRTLSDDWHRWKYAEHKKPYLDNNVHFNVSHSGKMVVVCFSDKGEVGVDIEQIKPIDTENMSAHFHKEEVEWLKKQNFELSPFYRLWTRKEALLKAKGGGILNGLNQQSTLSNRIIDDGEWYLKEIDIFDGYKCCICSTVENTNISIEEIDYKTLNNFINEKDLI